MIGIVFYGIAAAAKNRPGQALCAYALLSFLQMINPMLMPWYSLFQVITRLGSIAMTFTLIVGAGKRGGNHTIPIETLFLYLFGATISSTFGYFPMISYLKIFNFVFFILGLYIGTKNINKYPNAITEVRHFILALILLWTYGSLMTIPFPGVAYFTTFRSVLRQEGVVDVSTAISEGGRILLLSGITSHSQFLGPAAACCLGWLLCDMWLVKRRLSAFHLFLIAPIPLICFMTRSRLALLILPVTLYLTTVFCLPSAIISRRTRTAFWCLIIAGFVFLLGSSIYHEIRDQSISRWLRKTEEVSSDDRTLGQALTDSRQGLIDMNLADFRRNRLLGSGFQVAFYTRAMYNSGTASLFSATIEKGLLPLMVLGETGILGATTFTFFLAVFYSTCRRKRYIATATLFTVYLTTNIAEATFFAPSGGGGILWIMLVAGGFIIDMNQYVPLPAQFNFIHEPSIVGGALGNELDLDDPEGEFEEDCLEP